MSRKMLSLAKVVLASLILASFVVVAPVAAQSGPVSIEAPIVTVAAVGNAITIQLDIDLTEPSAGAAVTMDWDPAVMSCSTWDNSASVFHAAAYSGGLFLAATPNFDNVNGRVSYAVAGLGTPANGHPDDKRGKLVTFGCTALLQDSLTELDLQDVSISDPNGNLYPQAIGIDGRVIVGAAPGKNLVVRNVVASTIPGVLNAFNLDFDVVNIGNVNVTVGTSTGMTVNGEARPSLPIGPLAMNGGSQHVSLTNVSFGGASAQVCLTADAGMIVDETVESDNTTCVTFSAVSDTDTTTIECTQPRVLDLTAPEDISGCAFRIGWNTCVKPMNIKSNTSWEVQVSDRDLLTAGHMTEWNGTQYPLGYRQLIAPLHVLAVAEGTDVTLAGPGLLASGVVADQVLNNGENVDVTFAQEVFVADPVLPAGSVYRIVVTFLAYVTF